MSADRTRARPEDLIRPEILALSAYHVPPAAGFVKLDAMENPFALPEDLRRQLGVLAAGAAVNRYPDPAASSLKARLREAMGVPPGAELLLGNGSDEVIQVIALALARPGAVLMSVDPTFVMFRMIATYAGMRYAAVPLGPDFALDEAALAEAIERERPAVLFLAYPNNPTGNLFDADSVARIIERAPGLVVVDEAYHAFARRSFMDRLPAHQNLLVMRTLSKLGLAGLRVGLLAGAPSWIGEFEKLRLPYNVNVLSQVVAEAVLGRGDVLESQAASIRAERAKMLEALRAMPGVAPYPSEANFILFRVAEADAVFAGLKSRGVLIKNLNGSHPRLAGCLRVTVGTVAENRTFLDALAGSLPA